jgi:carboxymethylenebutenolidase
MCLDCPGKPSGHLGSADISSPARALDDPAISHGPIVFANGAARINGYIARPLARSPARAVIVTHGNAGLPEDMRNAAAQLAQVDLVGLLLDPTSRTPDVSKLSRDFLMSYGYLKLLMSDIQAALAYLADLHYVLSDGVGLLGFCGGGILNLLFAATQPAGIRAVVAFYAAPRVTPGTNSASDPRPDMITFVPQLTTPIQYHVGTEDIFIPPHDLQEFEAVLHSQPIAAEVYRYPGAEHGFYHYTYPDEYQPQAAEQARQRMCAFFQRYLV